MWNKCSKKVLFSDDVIEHQRKPRNRTKNLFELKRKFIKMAGYKKSGLPFLLVSQDVMLEALSELQVTMCYESD